MNTRSFAVNRALAVFFLSLILVSSSWAVKVSGKVLHSFSGPDGSTPTGALAVDALGNVYGTTALGGVGSGCGSLACGVVYELSPSGNGVTETVLSTFKGGTDGGGPQGGVILDGAGNLYGTTLYGGSGDGCGTVFQLTNLNGVWTKTVLHSFNSMSDNDGCFPFSGLTLDPAGNLYGTTASGGTYDTGAVFELTPNSNGSWNYSVIYNFQAGGSGDGANPHGTMVFGSGNLYGTTLNGGVNNAGTVFEMTPANGGWTETVIYTFDGQHGANPYSGVILDASGNLYGLTFAGGIAGAGVVFELTSSANVWTIQILHTFNGSTDGAAPGPGSLLFDRAGNLYGETLYGGHAFGVVFQLVPQQGGGWTETVLHSFQNTVDGRNPEGGLTMDTAGNLYGSTLHGGSGGSGIVFEGRIN